MTGLFVLMLAIGVHAFFMVSSIVGYLEGKVTIAFPIAAGFSLVCWIISVFSIAGLVKQAKPAEATPQKHRLSLFLHSLVRWYVAPFKHRKAEAKGQDKPQVNTMEGGTTSECQKD